MLSHVETDVLNRIDRSALLADLAALVSIRSLGGDETTAQEWMAARLRALGMDVDVWPIDFAALATHPQFSM